MTTLEETYKKWIEEMKKLHGQAIETPGMIAAYRQGWADGLAARAARVERTHA